MTLEKETKIAAGLCFWIGIAGIVFVLTLPGCQANMPPIDAQFWGGDSARQGISRSQENRTLECKQPEFDKYVCLTYEDLQKIYDTLLECKQWPTLATRGQQARFISENPEVIHAASHRPRTKKPYRH